MKSFHFLFCCLLLGPVLRLSGQTLPQQTAGFDLTKTYPSPDVASLGTFGLVPANPYNGQANISIPLYTVSYKELQVPITISYSTGGHQVDGHPGWAGLGWSLQTGGMVYRKVNGLYDEHPKIPDYTNEICYYYNCGRVTTNFNNLDSVKNYALDGVPVDQYAKYAYDAMPDEFVFNFNGYSGTFFITRPYPNGPVEIKVKPNGAYKLKAEITEIKDQIVFDDWVSTQTTAFVPRQSARSIYALKITDDRGIQYIFGGNAKAIEFSNNGNLSRDYYTIASTWHLTEMISPGGYKIRFAYKRAGRVFTQQKQRRALFYDYSFNFGSNLTILHAANAGSYSYTGDLESVNIALQNPAYLDSIITPLQTVLFYSSKSNELDYPFDETRLLQLTTPEYKWGAHKSAWQKLDEINVVGLRRIAFNYRHQIDKRLRLESIDFKNLELEIKSTYKFRYNPMNLPSYNARMADHWGYYNGRSYAYGNDYLTLREPVAQYLQAEMLDSIIYPTGGYLNIRYEPHYYRKIARQFPFAVDSQSNNIMAGGLRVSKVITAPGVNELPVTKEYFYVTNYVNNGTVSSGVLSGIPQYANAGSLRSSFQTGNFWLGGWGSLSLHYGKIIDNNYLPLSNTNGNHVTYSEVTERSGEGYIVYRYSNHDNGCHDKAPYIMHTNFDSKWHEEQFVSMESFRGMPLSSRYLDKNKDVVKEIIYEYIADTAAAFYRVPWFCRIYDASMLNVSLSRVSTGVYYSKPVLLKKQIETDYVAGTTSNAITITKTSGFFHDVYPAGSPADDNYKETSVKTVGSTMEELKTILTYPFDMVAASRDPNGIYQGMVDKNMVSQVVEQIKLNDTTPVGLTRTNYFSPFTGQYLPQFVEDQLGNGPVETRVRFHTYDDKGNLLVQSRDNDIKTSYIWNYKQAYPVAEVVDADQASVAYTSFESDGAGNWTIGGVQRVTGGITGRNCYQLANGNISKSGLSATAGYTLSYWTQNSNAFTITGTQGTPVMERSAGNWKCFSHELSGITTITLSGTGLIDELRLYPRESQMTTFSYDPLVGMTSQGDARNNLIYYEYDDFQRLLRVRDIDNNILKQYSYEYQPSLDPRWQPTGNVRCIKDTSDVNTGEQEREEKDNNPNSPTFNQVRWLSNGQNCAACATPANWVIIDTICEMTDWYPLGEYTGRQYQVRRDSNPCSLTYNDETWIFLGCNCPNPSPLWEPTDSVRCRKDTAGNNTGIQERQEKDINECSPTYNQYRWVSIGSNTTACPVPPTCNTSTCTGNDRKCINGVCTTGTRINTASTWVRVGEVWKWRCTYHYQWSDGTSSPDYYEYSDQPCALGCQGPDCA